MDRASQSNPSTIFILAGVTALGMGVAFAVRLRRMHREQKKVEAGNPTGLEPVVAPCPGDILLFFRPNRGRDYIIQWVTGSRFYHAALSAGGDKVVEARPRGVIEEGLGKRQKEFVVLPASGGKGPEALAWARSQIGAPFDTMDGLVIGLEHLFKHWKINYTKPGYYTCGEFVAAAYQQAGITLIPGKDSSEIAPGDLARLLAPNGQKENSKNRELSVS